MSFLKLKKNLYQNFLRFFKIKKFKVNYIDVLFYPDRNLHLKVMKN